MKRILVLVDDTEASKRTAECAARLANNFSAQLCGLSVANIPAWEMATAPIGIGTSAIAKQARQEALENEKKEAEQAVKIFTQVCKNLNVRQFSTVELEEEAEEAVLQLLPFYDILMFGMRTFPGEEEPEDLAYSLLRLGTRPILLVSPDVAEATPTNVLAAVCGNPQSAKALQMFLLLFSPTIVNKITLVTAINTEEKKEQALDSLKKLAEYCSIYGYNVDFIAEVGPPDEVLPNAAENLKADTILLGAFSKSAIERFLVGSITRLFTEMGKYSLFLWH